MAISEREAAHRAASDAERIAWVDEHDQLLGALPRAEVRERGLIGRGTFILLFDSAGRLCVHQRTFSKAVYPGYFDVAAGGMVGEGESYPNSARRELAEELGVSGVPLEDHGRFFFDQTNNRIWCGVFSAVWDGPLQPQPEEVLGVRFMTLDQVHADVAANPYCPDSLQALALWVAARG